MNNWPPSSLQNKATNQIINKHIKYILTSSSIPIVEKNGVLGVTLDGRLSFNGHITSVVHTCNYHLGALSYIHRLINQDLTNTVACFIVCSLCLEDGLL